MSTGLNCDIIEWKPRQWYYILEHGNAPKDALDWRENASAYGPYHNEEDALRVLQAGHANPGGFSSLGYDPKRKNDEVLANLIAKAKRFDPLGARGYRY